ncbi:hypothetical protein MASR1M36_17860 [Candidatus Cloacimonadaceae bacterium]
MRKLTFLGMLMLLGSMAFAQLASDYSFAYTAGTYTPISGGTVLGSATSDDQRFVDPAVPAGGTITTGVGFPIGFNFTYLGLVFDRVAINNNGWISLGQSSLSPAVNIASSSSYTPIGSTTAITPAQLVSRIVPFGRDLAGQTGSELRIETIGSAPNRELVVQWTNYRKYNNTGDNLNFQVRLQENGNKIVFVYGTITNNATSTTIQVGLRGEPATTASNWKNLSSTTSWTTPAAGGTNSASLALSNTVFPPSGTTYTWAPPVAGQPPNPAGIVSPANGATQILPTASLNWSSGGGMPTGYKLYWGTTTPPPYHSDLGLVTTFQPESSLSMNTLYYWQIVPYNANGDAAGCPIWSFTTHNGQVALTAPADAATNVSQTNVSFSWGTAPSATGYRLVVGSSSGSGDIYNAATTSPTVVPGPFAYNTTYYWSVYSQYPDGRVEYQSAERTFTTRPDPTVSSFPWIVDFGTTSLFPPLDWTRLEGLYGTSPVSTTNGWTYDDFGNVATTPPNYSGRLNIWSTTTKYWLVTPPIAIPGAGYELKFDLALTTYSTIASPTPGQQADDKFYVLVSDSPLMTAPTILRQWDNSGSEYVYDTISNTGENHTISLTGYTGTKYLAFYGESTVSGGDNNVYVDNVTVRETPSLPAMTLVPNVSEVNFGLVPVNNPATQQFTVTNTGGGTLNFNPSITAGSAYYSISIPPATNSLGAGQSTNFTVRYLPTAEGGPYPGTLTISDNRTIRTITLTGSAYAPSSLPFTETWESGQGNWQIVNGTQANKWYIGSVVAHAGSNSAFISNDSGVTNTFTTSATSVVHIYQDIVFTSGNYEFNLSFWHKGQGESTWDGLKVFLVDASVVPVAGTQLSSGQIGLAWYNLAADWTNVIIPLSSAYAGTTKRLVFTWVNDASLGAQPPVALDDISLTAFELAAPEPVSLVYPADDQTNLPKGGFNLSWTRSPTGSAPTYYIVHMGSSAETVYTEGYDWEISTTSFNPVTVATNPITFNYSDIWYWTVEAVNGVGSTVVEPPFSFQIEPDPAITGLPYAQNFDLISTPNLPSGWTAYKGNSAQSLYSTTTYSQTTPNSVYMYNSNYSAVPLRLISPQILVPLNTIKFSFWVRAGGTGYPLQIGTVNALDGTGVFTEVASITPSSSTAFVEYAISFAAYGGTDQYICIQHGQGGTYRSFYLDSFLFEQLFTTDLSATAINGDSHGIAGEQLSYQVSVKNNGTATQNSYTVNLMAEDTRVLLASLPVSMALAPDATALHTIHWTPSVAGGNSVFGEVVVAGDENNTNNSSPSIAVSVFAADSFIPQIGDINSLTRTNMYPIDMYYKNSLCETIYLPHELQMSSGTINAIVFQNNFTQDLTKPLKVWMKHTTESSLPTTFLDFTGYALVFDGSVHFPVGVNSIVIPLSTPFGYTGGNLAVRTYRVWENQWWNTSNEFYYTASAEYPNRTRYMYVDGDGPYNPETLTPYAGSSPIYGTVSNIPNTAFIVSPAVPFASLGTPAVSISQVGGNLQLDWAAVPNAYSYKIYASDDPYGWVGDPIATVRANTYTTASSSRKFFKVVAQTSYRIGEPGLALNPAAIIGFDNSKVKALPLIPNTANK